LGALGTVYLQFWSTFLQHGALAPKQEGMGGVKRGVDSFKAAAFLHILTSIPDHDYDNKEYISVLGCTWNCVLAVLEHLSSPWCTCTITRGFVWCEKSCRFLQGSCFPAHTGQPPVHDCNNKFSRSVLGCTWN